MKTEVLNYEKMVAKSLMQVVKEALSYVSDNGLPENHYFQITFATDHPDCRLSNKLTTIYPEEMTIILQHEFSNLSVDDDGFSVRLSFSNVPEDIYIPFSALRFFVDTPASFGLQFEPEIPQTSLQKAKEEEENSSANPPVAKAASGDTAEVIDFSRFKK